MIYDAHFFAAFRKRSKSASAVPAKKTTVIDFARYAGQLRPWTHRDAVVEMELEQMLIEELDRAKAKEEERSE